MADDWGAKCRTPIVHKQLADDTDAIEATE
jgi:hypothetical protein